MQVISVSGATSSTGLSTMAWWSVPQATAKASARATPTPSATPRAEKRALRVTTGMASQPSIGPSTSPVSATEPAMASSLSTHAPNSRYSGRSTRGLKRSATWNAAGGQRERDERPPAQPRPARDERDGDDTDGHAAHRANALVHVQEPLAVHVVAAEPRLSSHKHYFGTSGGAFRFCDPSTLGHMKLEGIHHITAITGDAPGNVDFYARVLGLRLVKKTVNQDDPTVYHLFYADEKGSAGSDLTFFEYPGATPGRAGAGMVHTIVWRVASPEAIEFWAERLAAEGVEATREDGRLRFADPEGLGHELAVDESGDDPLIADHPEVPPSTRSEASTPCARSRPGPTRAGGCSRTCSASSAPADGWEARGEKRGGRYVYDDPPAGPGHAERRDRPPRGLGLGDGRARGVAAAPARGGAHGHPGDRPLLLPLDLLPRALRRALRDRHARPRIHRRRAAEHLGERLSLPPDYEQLRDQVEGTVKPIQNPG